MGCCLIITEMTASKVGQQISDDIATCYRLDGPRTELWWGREIPQLSKTPPGSHAVQWIPGLFHGGKMAGVWS